LRLRIFSQSPHLQPRDGHRSRSWRDGSASGLTLRDDTPIKAPPTGGAFLFPGVRRVDPSPDGGASFPGAALDAMNPGSADRPPHGGERAGDRVNAESAVSLLRIPHSAASHIRGIPVFMRDTEGSASCFSCPAGWRVGRLTQLTSSHPRGRAIPRDPARTDQDRPRGTH
jgi:hypothetical protein